MPTLYWKLIGGAVGAIILGLLVASWMARGREVERLTEWQDTVVLATTAATVEPDKSGKRKSLVPSQVPAAIAALKASFDNADRTLDGINTASLKDKAIQDKLDSSLAAMLADQERRSKGTTAAITALLGRKGTGDKDQDCEIMAADSAAAWDGWRN